MRVPPSPSGELATRADLDDVFHELMGDMAELRREIRALFPKLIAVNIASMIGITAVVYAAASLPR